MKKLVSLLLAFCMACAIGSAPAEGTSPVGTWYLVRGEKGGTVVQTAGMISMEITFNEDGTGTMKTTVLNNTVEDTMTWTEADGILTVTDSTGVAQELGEAGDELTLETDGTLMFFSRTAPEAPDAAVAAKVTAESADQFDGRWIMSRVIVMGMVATPDKIGVENIATMEIENGVVRETVAAEGEKVTKELSSEFTDGHIKVTVPSEEVDGETLEIEYNLYLLEDGTLAGIMDIMGYEASLIYERIDEAAEEPAA